MNPVFSTHYLNEEKNDYYVPQSSGPRYTTPAEHLGLTSRVEDDETDDDMPPLVSAEDPDFDIAFLIRRFLRLRSSDSESHPSILVAPRSIPNWDSAVDLE